MDDCADGKSECSERHGQCYVQGCRTSGVPETKSFVTDVGCVCNGADGPGRQPPYLDMIGGHGKSDANEGVHGSENYHRSNPGLPA